MKRILPLFMAVLIITVCMLPALAADVVYVSLPVSVRASGLQPAVPEMVSIVLIAEDESVPMPAGSDDGVYTMSMQVGSQSAFPDIAYSAPGNYRYIVRQNAGSVENCVYDAISYSVEVCIAPGDDGIYPVIVVQEFGGSVKLDGITFMNAYPAATPTPMPTRPPQGDLPVTGVEDYWMFYLGGAMVCLLLAAFMLRILLRPEEANAADGGNPFRRENDE